MAKSFLVITLLDLSVGQQDGRETKKWSYATVLTNKKSTSCTVGFTPNIVHNLV